MCRRPQGNWYEGSGKEKKPHLLQKHSKVTVEFAIRHKDWTLEDWKWVTQSEETNLNCLRSYGRRWAWKRSGEGLSGRLVEGVVMCGGGSVMVWGRML